jgi:PPK2 family polyphosphate:nucleotide phosphotransferase
VGCEARRSIEFHQPLLCEHDALSLFRAQQRDFLVPFDGGFVVDEAPTIASGAGFDADKHPLAPEVARIAEAQRVLFAANSYAVLLIFQAMDAAGKDGTIRAVMSGVNPAGCHVVSFREPSATELDHDFLWRTTAALPERGRIGVFNRSFYEEVLIVRVHPELLGPQRLPVELVGPEIWEQRLECIRGHELHLARNGVVVLKFFLHVSRGEQRRRFLARLEKPQKHWKFSAKDVAESEHWPEYMSAYEAALNATSRPWAPWYCVPADDKTFMRYHVARIVADSLDSLDLKYPETDPATAEALARTRAKLLTES